jgi:hypothetical protein
VAAPGRARTAAAPGGGRDFRRLTGLLQQTVTALGDRAPSRPVWHCSVRAAPGDRMLSDDEWAQVAGEIMHRTGLSAYGEEDDAVRWVAIRHADDHIHIVATLARQDGGRPRLSNDYYRVREACQVAEARLGLRATAPGDRTAAARPTRAENEKTRRRGWQEAPRVTLRREVNTAAATAAGEQEFFARLQHASVQVRKRFSTRNPSEVTGYSVALPRDTTSTGEPVWYSGGKLAADLTLPNSAGAGPAPHPAAPFRLAGSRRRNEPRSGSMPLALRPMRLSGSDTSPPPAAQPRRPTRRGRPATSSTPQPPRCGAGSSGRLPAPMTAPPASRTAGSPGRHRPEPGCARSPGCCQPQRSSATTAPSPRPR